MKLLIITTTIFVSMVCAAVNSVGMPQRQNTAPTVHIIDESTENIVNNISAVKEGTCEEVEMALNSPKLFTPVSSRDPYTIVIKGDEKETHYNCVPFKTINSSIGYKESGKASWYGPGFHNRKTASGRIYDQQSPITVAHKTLPLGSILKVTTETASVCVLVDDRGPFYPGRVLDLSETIAKEVGVYQEGTADVDVELVGYINLKKLKGHAPKSISC